MRRRCPWNGHALLVVAAGLISCAPAWATVVGYTVDASQSTLTLSGSWNGSTLWQRPVGSLGTTYAGSIQADVGAGSVQILSADLDAKSTGYYRPRYEGRGGRQTGDYGGFFRTDVYGMRGNVNVALRDIALDLSSLPITVTNGAFDATGLSVSAASGVMDYAGAGLLRSLVGHGRADVTGDNVANAATTSGSLTTTASSETIIIPIQVTLSSLIDSPLPDAYDRFEWVLSGTIVATRAVESGPGRPIPPPVPEPATLSFLVLGVALLCKRR